jgi:hypothetical protein
MQKRKGSQKKNYTALLFTRENEGAKHKFYFSEMLSPAICQKLTKTFAN